MAALQLQRFVDGCQHTVRGMGGPCDVSVREDGKELRRGASEDPRGIDIANSAGQRGGHHLQRLFRRTGAVTFDQQHSEVPLIPVGPCQLILENRPHKPIVEEACRPVDDMERLSLWVVRPYPARRAEDRAVGQGGPASQACLGFRPAA